ncbi:2-dehydropantoate 2-reductase Pan5 [Schizosaccharomyces pombe]|uniref:Probable 2-dehydropantoate 2-reductase n=1 Tax=Schizosaccharomyces pombe (strain 972 / ATCC 24843) TaxID=284812 RepID=PANE_SCHPO|nr:putative 2-dehydropantoate 2-reductase [Schizosaccharomyces pombe]Q9HDU6.1 RecName: Full=Probable 2-dehydropantoate 2-reductase; AltName: Full=Ketopantoate reductase; Short=KPA reductase; Short=KPR [Schizosaccharomyces pombe 972h-]CAC21411.1 2-dehydropantoate 2-reductase (predicted) [Schizosaccharomyces pombe]|eukprot:NP_596855.1 putative 2-dehydropantoate 2-reductase [Schizosaccharomyces pombe]
MNNTIYILGAGSIGSLLAYELASLKSINNRVILLLRDKSRVNSFKDKNSTLKIDRLFEENVPHLCCQVTASEPSQLNVQSIENMIVTTKAGQTENALSKYLPYLSKNSNILFVQNGMGAVENVCGKLWPEEQNKPSIYQGVISHGCFQTAPFHFSHAGLGDLKISKVPKNPKKILPDEAAETPCEMIKSLGKSELLRLRYMNYPELLVNQCEKLVINACINPTTATLDCVNGELYNDESAKELFRCIIKECVDIFFKCIPLFKNNEEAEKILNVNRLLDRVMFVGTKVNGANSSSTRQDCLLLRETEIDAINGYVVKLAENNGFQATVNKTMMLLTKSRLGLNRCRAHAR